MQDHALTWYIKYSSDNPNARVADIQATLNREFSRPKSEAQSIIGFKEIMMLPGEMPWELDQRLKFMIREANMNLTDGQHRDASNLRTNSGVHTIGLSSFHLPWLYASFVIHLYNSVGKDVKKISWIFVYR